MYRKNVLKTFDLDYDGILEAQVEPVPTIELDAFVFNRKRNLSLEPDSAKMELVTETFFVR